MNISLDEVLLSYRGAWKTQRYEEKFYADDIEFYAPMKVFKGRDAVISAFKNWFMMFDDVLDFSYIIKKDKAVMLSKIFLKNSGGENYLLWENDYFEFNSNNQIKLYRPIFDSGHITHELLGFDIAARCSEARKLADSN